MARPLSSDDDTQRLLSDRAAAEGNGEDALRARGAAAAASLSAVLASAPFSLTAAAGPGLRPLTSTSSPLLIAALLASALLLPLLFMSWLPPAPPADNAGQQQQPHCPLISVTPSAASAPRPSAADGPQSSREQLYLRHELCRRADSLEEEADQGLLHINHGLLPFGRFSYPSLNVSLSLFRRLTPAAAERAGLLRPLVSRQWPPAYVELYVQEVLYDREEEELQLGVILLADQHRVEHGRTQTHHDYAQYRTWLLALTAHLTLSTSLHEGSCVSVLSVDQQQGLYWLRFRYPWTQLVDALPDAFTVRLHHPDAFSSSSSGGATLRRQRRRNASDSAAQCPQPDADSASLSFSLCSRSYRPVSFAYCSNALHTAGLLPHLRSFVLYHAFLGIHRFVFFDRGGEYRALLQPFIASGLVEYRYWPWPNRDFSSHPNNWSQLALISICAAFSRRTAAYYGLFDVDEWLTLPQRALTSVDLQDAQPVQAETQAAIAADGVFPSSCLSFVPVQPELSAEPDVAFNVTRYAASPYPLLRCDSMLSRAFAALQAEALRKVATTRHALHAQLQAVNATMRAAQAAARTEAFQSFMLESEQLPRFQYDVLDRVAIFVYDFAETRALANNRTRREREQQQQHELQHAHALQQLRLPPPQPPPSFFHSAAERFSWRSRFHRGGWHKAFYRASRLVEQVWVHPMTDRAHFVNPNVLRFHHFTSIITARHAGKQSMQDFSLQHRRDTESRAVSRSLRALNGQRAAPQLQPPPPPAA